MVFWKLGGLVLAVTLVVLTARGAAPSRGEAAFPFPTPPPLGVQVTVNTTSDAVAGDGFCSLREAIIATNNNSHVNECDAHLSMPGAMDGIVFNIGSGNPVIVVDDKDHGFMPAITGPLAMNGHSGGATRVVLRGNHLSHDTSDDIGLKIASTAAGTVISNLVLQAFTASAIQSEAADVSIEGNYIGTDDSGYQRYPNQNGTGIDIDGGSATIGGTAGVTPGGACTGDCNLISGNSGPGILASSRITVVGDYIGTRVDGNGGTGLENEEGLDIHGSGSVIGGDTPAARNVISGNLGPGVDTHGASSITIEGNFIGTNAAGNAAVANSSGIFAFLSNVIIGGPAIGQANVISGNTRAGIHFESVTDSQVLGNYIGTAADGVTPVPNVDPGNGIEIYTDVAGRPSTGNAIGGGGVNLGQANTIAFNTGDGVLVGDGQGVPSLQNSIRGNSIHDNGGLGIHNTEGGNMELPPPTIAPGGPPITGTSSCVTCTIDVYAASADEGDTYLGSAKTDGAGNWSYGGRVGGPNLTATVTDGAGNTSQFSSSVTEPSPTPTPTPTGNGSPTATPTPTSTHPATPTPTGNVSPTPTPTGGGLATPTATPSAQRIEGDVNCDGHVNDTDALLLLEFAAGLNNGVAPGSCPDLGSTSIAADGVFPWGDVDCDHHVDAKDSLYVFAFEAGFRLSEPVGCTRVGEPLG